MTLTRARTIQYVGILFALALIAVGYWYWSARAGVKSNTSALQPQGVGRLDSGLAGYWAMDNGSGTSATDSSTNGNTGTLTNGPTWTTGQIGSAVSFDGTNDYIDVGTAGLTSPTKLSGAAWIKVNDFVFAENYTIFSNRSAGNTGWSLITTTSGTCSGVDCGTLSFTIQNVASYTTSSDWVPEAQWTHVAFVWDGSNVSFYVNGRMVQTISTGSMTVGSNLLLGVQGPSPGVASYFMDGLIDEARVYDRVLSSDEMSQLYRLTSPTSVDTSLKGYWSFNGQDISGTAAYDRSGAGNTGTLTGGPARSAGIAGQALDFDGTDDYVTVPDNSALDVPSNFVSLSGWFNRDTATTDDVIIAKRNGVAAANAGYIVYLDATTDKLVFEVSDGTDEYSLTSTTAFTAPGWHHFAVTYEDDVVSSTEIYIDGLANNAVHSGTIANIGDITNAVSFVVGAESDAGSPFDGRIDEIRVYQGLVLQAAQIKSLFMQAEPDAANTSALQTAGTGRLESGLTAYWRLDDGTSGASPTTAADSSTNGIAAGTLTNSPTWTTGQIGSAVDFDGTDDYIAVADTPLLDFGDTDDFALAGWFNRDTATTDDVIVAKRTTVLAGATGYVAYLDATTDKLVFEVSDGTDEYSLSSASTFTSGAKTGWHHFAIVWDQDSSGGSEIYIDGIADGATDSGTIGNVGDLSNALQFGIGVNSLANNPFDGKIDEVRVYSRTLSLDEIVELYRLATPTSIDTSLKGYWSFNGTDISATTAYDRSGAVNNGTLTGGPTKTIGIAGQALSFDNSDDYISVSDNAVFTQSALTVSFWKKNTNVASNSKYVTKSATGQRSWSVESSDAGRNIKFIVSSSSASESEYGETPNGGMAAGEWYHVVAVFNGAGSGNAGRMQIYINGVAQSVTFTGTIPASLVDAAQAVTLGGKASAVGFLGQLDEVRIHNRALSATEIKSLYDASAPDKGNSSASQPQGTGRLDSGLAGYWKLDENTGTSASDASTNGNTGTLTNGPTWTTGQIGSAVTFDGSNDNITIATSPNLELTTTETISAWVYISTPPSSGNEATIFYKYSSGDSNYLYRLALYNNSSTVRLLFAPGGGGGYSYSTTSLSTGQWYHVMVTFNKPDVKFYLNGALDGTSTDAVGGGFASGSGAALIGGGGLGVGYLNGKIDEVRVYNRALSSDEASQLYRLSSPTGTDTSLKAYWSFNGQDISGTTAYDRSGAGNTGTLTGGPTKTIGKLGQGLNFDGTDDYIASVANSSAVAALTQGSFAFWLKPRAAGNQGVIFRSGADGGGNSPTSGFEISGDLWAGTQTIRFMTAGSTGDMMARSTTTLTLNTWTHVVVVWDGTLTAANVKFYLNGALDTTVTQFNGSGSYVASDGSSSFGIPDGGGYRLDGILDEFRVYNRQLSADEVMALYNQSK